VIMRTMISQVRIKVRDFLILPSIICLIFVFLYRNLSIESMWSFSDLLAFNRATFIDTFLSSWTFQFLGYHHEKPLQTFQFLLQLLIENDVIAQKIFFLSFLPIAFMAMYIFVRNCLKSFWSRLFSSFLFSLNPLTVGEFVNGSTWMISYAIFPLILYFLLRIFDARATRDAILYGLCISILISLSEGPLWALLCIFSPIFFTIFSKLLGAPEISLKRLFKVSILVFTFILIGFALHLPKIHNTLFLQQLLLQPQFIASYLEDIKFCYSKAVPQNLLRLAGNAGSPMGALGYNNIAWWTILGIVIPMIAFIPLINRKKEMFSFDLSFSLMVCLITLFIFLTHERITYPLFLKFPALFSLRNPKNLMYPLAFGLSFLFGRGLDDLLNLAKKFESRKRFFIQLLLIIIVGSSLVTYVCYPLLGGDMGLGKVRGDSYIVPASYYKAINVLRENSEGAEFYRVLWLPYTYQVQTRIVNVVSHFGARLGQTTLPTPNTEFVEDLFRRIERNEYENFSEAIALFNIKYIVIDRTQRSAKPLKVYKEYGTPFISGNPELFNNFICKQNKFLKIYEDNDFIIYKNNFCIPHLSVVEISKLTEKRGDNGSEIKLRSLIESLFTFQSEGKILYFIEKQKLDGNFFKPVIYSRDKSTLTFKVNITEPSIIVMAESYHIDWVAYANGQVIPHLRAVGWANGFLISKPGEYNITIKFRPQNNRDLMISAWLVMWGTVITAFCCAFVYRWQKAHGLRKLNMFLPLSERKRNKHLDICGEC